MANNIVVKDASGLSRTMQTVDNGGVHLQAHVLADGSGALIAGANPLPITIASGDELLSRLGQVNDAKVAGDQAGTISAKLRAIATWAMERMPASIGQKPMAQSLAVVLPSDQIVNMNPQRSASGAFNIATTVGTSATQVIGANATRKSLMIHNNSANRIWLGTAASVVANSSGPNFGFLDEGDAWESDRYTGAIFAITSSGTAHVVYLELQ